MKVALLPVLLLMGLAGSFAAAAEEHDRARAEPRAEARGPAPGRGAPRQGGGRQSFDGRGQILDSRYNHGRYYPPMGTVRSALPEGYRPCYRSGNR